MKRLFSYSIFIVVIIAFAGIASCGKDNSVSQDEQEECEPAPYFTHLPVAEEVISYFIVLGQFNPPGDVFPRGQTGLQLKSPDLTPLYAVGDIDITWVESTHWLESPEREGHTDYTLSFVIPDCRSIYGNYEHIASLEANLEAHLTDADCEVYSTVSETVEKCGKTVKVPVTAGTVLGLAGGETTGLDFDLFDKRVTHDFVAAHRYPGPAARWSICPQPLFIPSLRDVLLSKTGRGEFRRVDEPRCGTMEIDSAGTAQGMWVLEEHDVVLSFETYDKFFALAPHDLQPETFHVLVTAHPAFEVSPAGPVVFSFRLENSGKVNRRFSELPADGTLFCYEPQGFPETSFFIALGNNGKVTIERNHHTPKESPCQEEIPETWEFTGSAITLMR